MPVQHCNAERGTATRLKRAEALRAQSAAGGSTARAASESLVPKPWTPLSKRALSSMLAADSNGELGAVRARLDGIALRGSADAMANFMAEVGQQLQRAESAYAELLARSW